MTTDNCAIRHPQEQPDNQSATEDSGENPLGSLHSWTKGVGPNGANLKAVKIIAADNISKIDRFLIDATADDLARRLSSQAPIIGTFSLDTETPTQTPVEEDLRASVLWIAVCEGCRESAIQICRLIYQSSVYNDRENPGLGTIAMSAAISAIASIPVLATAPPSDELQTCSTAASALPDYGAMIIDPHAQVAGYPVDLQAFYDAKLDEPTAPETSRTQLTKPARKGSAHTTSLIDEKAKTLAETLPWASDQIASIFSSQRLRSLSGPNVLKFPPMLLIGPPGSGQGELANGIAEAAGIPVWRTSAAGRAGALELNAGSPSLNRASPSIAVRAMNTLECSNPIVLLENIDKYSGSQHNGDPYAALAALIGGTTPQFQVDEYVGEQVDLTQVSWIFTAEDKSTIPSSLLDRLSIYDIPAPGREHFDHALNICRIAIARDVDTAPERLPILDPAVHSHLAILFEKTRSLHRLKIILREVMGLAGAMKSRLN